MANDNPTPPMCACGCGQTVTPTRNRRRQVFFCLGHQCIGSAHYNWKGGTVIQSGYVRVKSVGHPRASKGGYVKRATLVIEAAIGRPLADGEIVHHINGIKTDDRPENLKLMKPGDHTSEHTRGEANHNARLTEQDIRDIRRMRRIEPQAVTARRHNISLGYVSKIQLGQCWTHVTQE